jgi:hypothetical protein
MSSCRCVFECKSVDSCARHWGSLSSLRLCLYGQNTLYVHATRSNMDSLTAALGDVYQLRDTRWLAEYTHLSQHAKHACEVQDRHCATWIVEENHLAVSSPLVLTRKPGERDEWMGGGVQ